MMLPIGRTVEISSVFPPMRVDFLTHGGIIFFVVPSAPFIFIMVLTPFIMGHLSINKYHREVLVKI